MAAPLAAAAAPAPAAPRWSVRRREGFVAAGRGQPPPRLCAGRGGEAAQRLGDWRGSAALPSLAAALAAAALAGAARPARGSVAALRRRSCGGGRRAKTARAAAAVWKRSEMATKIDLRQEIAERPRKRIVGELSRYEDPSDPVRPLALPRPRQGKWAPPLPEAVEAPQALIVGFGRQLRELETQGPRARLGAGAVEALLQRHGVATYFDADVKAYVGDCRASMDRSGSAGVQQINFLQPVTEREGDVASALHKTMQRPGMSNATILFVLSDWRLPYGQIRVRSGYDGDDDRVRLSYAALSPDNQINCLHIGVGHEAANKALTSSEIGALPRVMANAAAAMEVWLSEADLGLVMRFVNRPEVYEMPLLSEKEVEKITVAGLETERDSLRQKLLDIEMLSQAVEANRDPNMTAAKVVEGLQRILYARDVPEEVAVDEVYNVGQLLADPGAGGFVLFDTRRDDPAARPLVASAPPSPAAALATLRERPSDDGPIILAGRRFASLAAVEADLSQMILAHEPGMHLRLEDDENAIRTLLAYHPEGDRLLEDLVAVKVDCSPVDDLTRCLWVIKFDGYEEDVSLKTCLRGLKEWIRLHPDLEDGPRRLGPGRWTRGLRESTYDRGRAQEVIANADYHKIVRYRQFRDRPQRPPLLKV